MVRGVDFLLAAQETQGWWTDFNLAAGPSDEWVTGYVGAMLVNIGDVRAYEAAVTAWRLLNTRRHRVDGKWGYNRLPPGDADSTGWALQLARSLGQLEVARARDARRGADRALTS